MKNAIILFALLFISYSITAQKNTERYNFEIKNLNLQSSIEKIEDETKFQLYFNEKWFTTSDLLYTYSYANATIDEIVFSILEKTDLNYFIDEKKIILTKNVSIRSQINSIQENKTLDSISLEKTNTPIFFKQEEPTSLEESQKIQQVVIGKENKLATKKRLTLSGFVINKKNNEAISNIYISLKDKKINTETDNLGFYKLELEPGVNYVSYESLNFHKKIKKIILFDDGNLNVSLDEIINQLNEVVIDNKKDQKIRSTITGATIIDIENIKNVPLILGERDIFRVAAALPGIKNVGEGASGYSVRGGKEDQNLILLDGGIIYNPSHFFGLFSAVNPFTTKKAIIYKGSIPAEFGGRLSSVFDITTKNGDKTKTKGEGGIGPVTSNLSLEVPIVKNKSSLLVGGRATYSGWILRSLNEDRLQNSNASFYDVIAKYSHDINQNNSIESTFYTSNDEFSISSDSVFRYKNRLFSLKWNHNFTKNHKSDLIFTNSDLKFNIDYDSNNAYSFNFGYRINESQAQLKFENILNKKHKFTYGIASKFYAINPGDLSPKNATSILSPISIEQEHGLESALYFSENFKATNKLLFEIGVRYSHYIALGEGTQKIYQENVPINQATFLEEKKFDKNQPIKTYGGFEPRFSARYSFTDSFSLKVGYDKSYQYIHLLSSNTTQSPTDSWKLSDINIKPQVSEQFSVGLFKNINKKDIELSLEGYYKKSENFLDYKVAAQLLLNPDIETELLQGKGKAYGVEFLIKKTFGALNGWVGYTYSRTLIKLDSPFDEEKVNNGNYFAANFDKPHDVSIVLNYKLTHRYSFSGNCVYQTGRPITYPIGAYQFGNAQYTLYSDRNKYRIPDYFRIDLGFNVEGSHKIKKLAHSFWNVSVYNVIGRNNPYSIFFVTKEGEIKAYKTSIFAIQVPTITYNFKF